MKQLAILCAGLLAAGAAQAGDGFSLGIGADYSSGDYGSDVTTEIFSVPVNGKYVSGNWTFKGSLPWLDVTGDPNVLPGLGRVDNNNPNGRGRGNGNGNGNGNAPPPTPEPVTEDGSASGIGDLRLSAAYAFDTGGPLGVDLTGNVKIATADEDKSLGTGANDYGVALDLYRDFDGTMLFGGVSYTMLGDSDFIDVDAVGGANAGVSQRIGSGNLGVMYDYRQAASDDSDDRSEVIGFYGFGAGANGRMQLYGSAGLSDGSPEWGAGLSYMHAF
ncbi:transporter [Lysobacter niastensis]|uniref:Transporter n=1 Tax=Lysobacter niastensis TaxID=380629 RepID=A0ABS0B562_9GAMM|nr:transporter [Lysobacter niastensis]MBF6023921.1 transporter [Lysobacter niastensis]